MKFVEKRGGVFWPNSRMKRIAWLADANVYKTADGDPIKFWEKLAEEGISWNKRWEKAYEEKLPYFKWFVKGRLNVSYNCLDRHIEAGKGNKTALIFVPEPLNEKTQKISYRELYDKVNRCANLLLKSGIRKGDVVAIYLPLMPEIIISMLACARIGAIHSVVFSAFSAEALKTRLLDGKAKLLITADGYYRRGKIEELKKKADAAVKGTSVRKIILVNRVKKGKNKFKGRKYVPWQEINKQEGYCRPRIMESNDILFILYTSGCCHGDSLIQLANGEIRKIKDIVKNNVSRDIINVHSSPLIQTRDKITHLHRYPNNSVLYKVRTPSFETTFTPDHRLFSLDEKGNLIEKEVGNLNKGDKVFVVSKINIRGEKQPLPRLKQEEKYRNKTTYRPKNTPKIPDFLTSEFAQILGYFTGDGHLDKRSVIFTDKDIGNLESYQKLIKRELGLSGNIRKITRQRLLINSSLFRNYIKEFFSDIISKSKERTVPQIIQKSENECIAGFLRGLFDAEGTIGHNFVKLSNTSEELIRISQLLLRRLGVLAKVYHGINKERVIKNRKIKETSLLDIIISERESLEIFYREIGFSDKSKESRLENLMKVLSSKRITPKDRFPVFSLLKEITHTIKVDWRGDFSKITKFVYYNQTDRKGLKIIRDFLDSKIKEIKKVDKGKSEKLRLIKEKIQKLMKFDGVVLEKILDINKVDNEYDFVYDITAEKNHNYIASGFVTHNTTGKPKGVIHDNGGYMTQAYWTTKWDFDLHENDVIWCTADIGWITGHTYACYGPLSLGCTSLIYEGAPDFPNPGRWWEIIQDNNVSVLYTAPTAIRMFVKSGDEWPRKYDLSNLRILGTVGEPIDKEAWMWYFEKIGGGRCPVIDTWWQTETGGTLINALPGIGPFIPTVAGRSFPGTRHIVVDEGSRRVKAGENGYLVQLSPFAPGMLKGVYKNDKKYRETYWGKFKGKYDTSDGAYMDKNGYIRLTGRVDDVMKVAGHRLSTAELENAIDENMRVDESAVVPVPDSIKGQVPVAFVVLKKGVPSPSLEKQLIKQVEKSIGPIARPAKIYFVEDLPKTRSGKIIRRVLKFLLNKEPLGDLSTLVNPESVEKIRKVIEQSQDK